MDVGRIETPNTKGLEPMKVIGIIGGIASGKSTVAKALQELGAGCIDADKIGHDVLLIPEIKQQMELRWEGNGYGHLSKPNGELCRNIIANIVFSDPEELAFLNAICHPIIEAQIEEKLGYYHPDYIKAVILDVPLLLEANWNGMCDIILFVDSSIEKRGNRAAIRKECPLDLVELKKRESFQHDVEMKREFATHTIDNNCSEKEMLMRVNLFWNESVNV